MRVGFVSVTEGYLKPYMINRVVFFINNKLTKKYNNLILSNKPLENKFNALENHLNKVYFNSGHQKGLQ